MAWWQERMSDDDSNGFRLASYSTACCGAKHTRNELKYEWSSGFARFALEARNPSIGSLDDRHRADFEEILGTRLRVIYRHY